MYCLKPIQNKMRRVRKREGRKEEGREGGRRKDWRTTQGPNVPSFTLTAGKK